ncbi:C-terminal processing protease CtpA/Prc [Flavobacterium arsenatis]|uniref:C-terminal processing protease CtpA/Prc n=1 Tax=Flavobacterium arsenatis TaxID=1484332 RepID=A0ABU1TJ99_9FLAO|nr:S41 family peptidase [Flavobacterium arsenatis]MDR6966055.1 C-terminal processing protease CtpA/Prc [Flavobacterium arsenatis]
MRQPFYIILGVFFISTISFSQTKKKLSDKHLISICKTWGLLKYYDPIVSNGKIDADSLLLSALEQKLPVEKTISIWIDFLKTKRHIKTSEATSCTEKDDRNLSFEWINKDKNLTKSQKKYLSDLVKSGQIPGGFYSQKKEAIRYSGNNEKSYKDKALEENYRLLNLFRAWNVIEYFYPYKYGISKKWDDVLVEFIPKIKKQQDELSYKKTLSEFSGAIEDTHSRIEGITHKEIFGSYGAPFTFQIAENKIVVTKPIDAGICEKLGIKYGDVIETVDGESVEKIIAKKSKYISASNASVKYRDSYHYMFSGEKGSFIIKGFDRTGKPFHKEIERMDKKNDVWFADGTPDNELVRYDEISKKTIYSVLNKDNIGFIDFSLFENSEIDSVMKSMKNSKGIVFDLRGYSSNGGVLKTFDYLFPEPKWFGILTKPDFDKPGRFCWQDYIITEDYKFIGKENPDYYKGKVVILVNQNTQSLSEMWAMIFKMAPDVTVIGSQTAGADGNETPIPLVGGESMIFSGVGIFYTDKTETQRIGIVPDILVKPTISDLQHKIDPLINSAFDFILK